ncbi:hypothetical protein KAJ89_00950 [Candidatus Parcubacteria bacterium]|nr:hypothetical protein [Candidatus Parcubacteria bacterium]
MEKPKFLHNKARQTHDSEITEKMTETEIKHKLYDALDKTIFKQLNERSPKLQPKERQIKKLELPIQHHSKIQLGVIHESVESVGYYDKVRESKYRNGASEQKEKSDTWLLVDFDDVIFQATAYKNNIRTQIRNILEISNGKFEKIYNTSKIKNESKNKMFQFDVFINKLIEINPDKEKEINSALSNINLEQYVDKAICRALLAMRTLYTGSPRITILTSGELNFQKMKVDGSGVDEYVDDIIYTDRSKKEVVEAGLKEWYPDSQPFIITIDDSARHVDDYNDLNTKRRFANIHYNNPQASRYNKFPKTDTAIKHEGGQENYPAIDMFKAVKIAKSQYAQEDREKVFKILENPARYDNYLDQWGGFRKDMNISYSINGNTVTRNYKQAYRQFETDNGRDKKIPTSSQKFKILQDGILDKKDVQDTEIDINEYIKDTYEN